MPKIYEYLGILIFFYSNELRKFKEFLATFAQDVVQKWIDYFILHKEVEFERITKKVK
jgi:hypothetical protein